MILILTRYHFALNPFGVDRERHILLLFRTVGTRSWRIAWHFLVSFLSLFLRQLFMLIPHANTGILRIFLRMISDAVSDAPGTVLLTFESMFTFYSYRGPRSVKIGVMLVQIINIYFILL